MFLFWLAEWKLNRMENNSNKIEQNWILFAIWNLQSLILFLFWVFFHTSNIVFMFDARDEGFQIFHWMNNSNNINFNGIRKYKKNPSKIIRILYYSKPRIANSVFFPSTHKQTFLSLYCILQQLYGWKCLPLDESYDFVCHMQEEKRSYLWILSSIIPFGNL